MKNKTLLLLIAVSWAALLTAQSPFKNLTFSPAHPKPGETVQFEYDLQQSPLRNVADAVTVRVLDFTEKMPDDRPVLLQNDGDKITGSFTPGPKALVVALDFEAGERRDNNSGDGYFLLLHGADGKPLPESRAAQAVLYRDWGYLFELDRKPAMVLALFDAEFADNPLLKKKYFAAYVPNLLAVRRGAEGEKAALDLLGEIEKDPKTSEKDLVAVLKLYDRLKATDRATALKERLRRAFPQGALVQQERQQAIQMQADLARREVMIDEYLRTFPPQTDADRTAVEQLWSRLAAKLADQKLWDRFKITAAKLGPAARAEVYNNIAWDLAEHGEDLAQAQTLAAEAAEWAKRETADPTTPKPAYETVQTWRGRRDDLFAGYADTYAFVLDKNGDPASAATWQHQAVAITRGQNTEMNERLTGYLERAKAPDLRYQLEGFVLKGQASDAMKAQFKRLYAAEDRSEAGATAYLAQLEKVAQARRRQELAGQMLNRPAPAFSLKNLAGEPVSLESLRGKVVVVDFWATWCGPCKASFPGMQTAVNQYKNDPQVAFVFVDTWEKGDDKVKNAADFIREKGYPFQVLLDLDDRVVADYGVQGIPTKFVVDRSGMIRFKAIGFDGSASALVDELNMMIELAKAQP